MNRTHTRRQIDVNKPLIKVEVADEFFNKENEEGESVLGNEKINAGGEFKKKSITTEAIPDPSIPIPAPKKQEIIIPVTKTVEEAAAEPEETILKKRRLQNHYVRISYIHPQPNPNIYEPSDKDLQFLKELNEKVPKSSKGSNEITIANFAKTFEAWEIATDKNNVINLTEAQAKVDNMFPGPVKDVVPKLYEYWKNLRESYQRPLLRKFWRVVNKDETNPNAAFRARENPKMKTRRTQRTNEQENLEKMQLLHKDLETVTVLLGNVRYREMLKMEMFDLSMMKFESALREKSDQNKFVERFKESYENESYIKLRNKMKDYNKDAEKLLINLPPTPVPEPEPVPVPVKQAIKPTVQATPGNSTEELNFDLGSFIATIIDESLSKDVTPFKVQDLIADLPNKPNGDQMEIEIPKKPAQQNDSMMSLLPSPMQKRTEPRSTNPMPSLIRQIKSVAPALPPPHQPTFEEKSILRYVIRRRIGRQKRMLLEKIFDEDESNTNLFVHPKDYYEMDSPHKEILITPEVAQKLPNSNLRQLYLSRFEKFRDICPFNDSEEENDMTESTKMIKSLATNFKNFMKQRRPTIAPMV